ncbi:MAG: DUF2892 domain-containing protein [Pseudomonadota bacterium]
MHISHRVYFPMIERNIGLPERVIRFLLGIGLIAWVVTGSEFSWPQGLALVAAFALLWNSIFARCYLWKWLRISSCDPSREDCPGTGGSSAGA